MGTVLSRANKHKLNAICATEAARTREEKQIALAANDETVLGEITGERGVVWYTQFAVRNAELSDLADYRVRYYIDGVKTLDLPVPDFFGQTGVGDPGIHGQLNNRYFATTELEESEGGNDSYHFSRNSIPAPFGSSASIRLWSPEANDVWAMVEFTGGGYTLPIGPAYRLYGQEAVVYNHTAGTELLFSQTTGSPILACYIQDIYPANFGDLEGRVAVNYSSGDPWIMSGTEDEAMRGWYGQFWEGGPTAVSLPDAALIHKVDPTRFAYFAGRLPGLLGVGPVWRDSNSLTLTRPTAGVCRTRIITWSYAKTARTFGTPSAPTNLAAQVTGLSIALTWRGDNTGETNRFRVYRTGTVDPIYEGQELSYTDTGLEHGTAYTYTVRSVNIAGTESAASNSAGGTAASNVALVLDSTDDIATTSNVTVTASGLTKLTLYWEMSMSNWGGGSGGAGSELFSQSTNSRLFIYKLGGNFMTMVLIGDATRFVFNLPSGGSALVNNTTYHFRAEAIYDNGSSQHGAALAWSTNGVSWTQMTGDTAMRSNAISPSGDPSGFRFLGVGSVTTRIKQARLVRNDTTDQFDTPFYDNEGESPVVDANGTSWTLAGGAAVSG